MTINPNWPVLLYEWGPHWACNGAAQPLDSYIEVTARTRGRTAVQRGRQYELDQIRAGTLNSQWANNDGALDPGNSGGPWYGHIMPYQPVRIRAQWPPTVNLLTQVQATGGDLGGYSPGLIPGGQQGISVFSITDSTGGSIVASGTAWQGTNVFQFAVPAATPTGTFICWTPQVPSEPGTTYSEQMHVRNISPSTTVSVQAVINWHAASGSLISTVTGSAAALVGSATAAWTQIAMASTAPTNAAYFAIGFCLSSTSPGSALNTQVDGWQVEKAAAPTTWVTPGITYPIYSGFVERFPSSWSMSGTYGVVSPTGVDTLSLLSQRILRDPLTEEIYSRNPRFLFTLGDPNGTSTYADALGAYPPAPLAVSKYGPGTVSSGTQITATNPVTGVYTGSSSTVTTFTNPGPGTILPEPATFISLSSAGIKGPTTTEWTRMVAFRWTAGGAPSNAAALWSAMDGLNNSELVLYINSAGQFQVTLSGPSGLAIACAAPQAVADGNWHLAIASYSHASGFLTVSVDGASTFYVPGTTYEPKNISSDCVGTFVDVSVGNGTTQNFQGDLSFVAEFPSALYYATDIPALYSAWKNSFAGDSSNARYSRILGWAGFVGPTNIQPGLTLSMGPAVTDGQDALTALQEVVDTENGAHFVDRTGTLTFQARSARYNSLVPMWTFGENTAGGEIPYEDMTSELDPTRLANQISITQASSNQVFSAQDATSITDYFPRQLTRTINASGAQECQDAANYLLSRYKQPAVRVSSLKLHPSANPSVLWPVCLSLELGARIRVMRRPPTPAATIQVDCFVENIAWELDDQGDAWVTLQCSPVDTTPYGIFASFHTALASTISSGVSTITINAGADNTNPAASQLSYGQQLVLGQNTANQETVTIKSVGATTAGWTTASITLQAATTKSHAANDVVCEPLPTGFTDPTTWDGSSKFDQVAFTY